MVRIVINVLRDFICTMNNVLHLILYLKNVKMKQIIMNYVNIPLMRISNNLFLVKKIIKQP